uniref:TNFR-Cys domain-containing protein n=1 Tax=Gadus morhua TaxID=8049 RepID=A0A8C4ZAD3_GADMO
MIPNFGHSLPFKDCFLTPPSCQLSPNVACVSSKTVCVEQGSLSHPFQFCPTGQYVSQDCTLRKYTVCLPCSEGTFNNGSNGLKQCFPCTDCASGLGFKLKKQCTTTSDALCEVLDGYFCKDSVRGGCMAVQRHKDCSPGQYISQRGTASQDTVCLNCNHGTFSNANSTYCRPHKM